MKPLAALLLLLATALPAEAQENKLTRDVFRTPGLGAARPDPEPDPIDDFVVAPEPVLRLLARRYRVRVTALRFEGLPPEVAALEGRVSPVLTADDEAALRGAARQGRLELVGIAEGEGRVHEKIAARSAMTVGAVVERDVDSAIGVSVEFPVPVEIQGGLDLSARIVLVPGKGVLLRYRIRLSDTPTLETRPTLGGDIEEATVPTILLTGGIRLEAGETAAAVFRNGSSDTAGGTLLLLRLEGPAEPTPAMIDAGEDAVLAVAGHLAAEGIPSLPWPDSRASMFFGFLMEDEDEEAVSAFDDFIIAFGDEAGSWGTGILGIYEGIVERPGHALLTDALRRAAECRGRRGRVVVGSMSGPSASIPSSPGESFSFFSGTLRAVWGGIDARAGCHECIVATAATAYLAEGFAGAGRGAVDGTVDLRIQGRRILDRSRLEFPVRRIHAGYGGYSFEPAEILLETDRTFRFAGALPVVGADLPGDLHGRYMLPPHEGMGLVPVHAPVIEEIGGAFPVGGGGWLMPTGVAKAAATPNRPVPYILNGRPFPVRADAVGLLLDAIRTPALRRWQDDGWCGMRMRFPLPDFPPMSLVSAADEIRSTVTEGEYSVFAPSAGLWEGVVALLSTDRKGRTEVVVEIRDAPESLGRFDPGDGVVDLFRQPRLRAEAERLVLRGGGRLAWGAGKEISLTVDGLRPGFGPHELVRLDSADGEAGLRTGRVGLLEAGGVTLLPQGFELYSSNHDCGEVSTAFAPVADGLAIQVEAKRGVVYTDLFLAGPATRLPHRLATAVYPPRDRPDLTTICVARRRFARTFVHAAGESLDYQSPLGSKMPFRLRAGGE